VSFLIDTCALSELVKPKPSRRVSEWFDAAPPEALFVSVLTLGEIRKGIENLGGGGRRAKIAVWLEAELPAWFEDRILPVDIGVADEWGRLMARLKTPVPAIDGLIAATALRHRFAIVTRNQSDFAATGVKLLNPWKD
jgi:predicted nucleic acid-binding protein